MDLSNIMNMANQLKEQMADAQSRAHTVRVSGESGGGLVRVDMSGRLEVLEVKIDPKAVDPNDIHLLEDLLRAAVNDAVAKAGEAMKGQMGSMAEQFGVDLAALGMK